jgi:hypothetical protein
MFGLGLSGLKIVIRYYGYRTMGLAGVGPGCLEGDVDIGIVYIRDRMFAIYGLK